MKILSANQIKALDAYTIQHEPVSSINLMERACAAFTQWFEKRFDTSLNIGIVCGTGNNGGDGLGIARLLHERQYTVQVWIVRGGSETDDFKKNLQRLPGEIPRKDIIDAFDVSVLQHVDVVIDALFGSGLSRPLEGVYRQTVEALNQSYTTCVAIDVPSGLQLDSQSVEPVLKADYTVTFQLPKLSFLLPQTAVYTGEWYMVDIGLDENYIADLSSEFLYVTEADVRDIVKPRSRFDHKGTFGHALLVAGSYGKMGAAILSCRAALRSGVGLLTTHVPKAGHEIIQGNVPEAMAVIDPHEHFTTTLPDTEPYTTIGIGPGLGQSPETIKAFRGLLEKYRKPLVLDADALNILSTHRELLPLVPPGSILSPHPKEFERLVGKWANDFERLEKQRTLAHQLKAVVIVKGAYTSIASPDRHVYFNSTGNPGMATGGSGDVLTGVLTALLAQRYSPRDAAILGVYIHGLAGDMAAEHTGMISLIPSDIIDFLPHAFRRLTAETPPPR